MPGVFITRGSSLRIPAGGLTLSLWTKNRTSREKRIVEVLKLAFALKPEHPNQIAAFLRALFTLRNQAVHPPSKYQPPSYHKDLDVGVEWRFVQFSAENARAAFDSTANLLSRLLEMPKLELDEFQQWIPSARALLAQALGEKTSGTLA
jgi:hypothetical protein